MTQTFTKTQTSRQKGHEMSRPGEKPDKGKMNGSCNRFACQAPGATWYNHSTERYYCERCALDINNFKPPGDTFLAALGHDLCTPPDFERQSKP